MNIRLRTLTTASILVVTGTILGATTQHFASAELSSGDRPVLVPIEPCRLADTRTPPNGIGPRSTPLGAAETYTIDAQEPGTECTGDIPTDALALLLNITALNATRQTFLTVWADGPLPLAASLNPTNDQPPIPNAVTTDLSATQTFNIYNDAGSVNVVVDVNGYYVNHNHDDRYPLSTDIDATLATKANTADVYTKTESDDRYLVEWAVFTSGGSLRASSPGLADVIVNQPPTPSGYYCIDLPDDVSLDKDGAMAVIEDQVAGFQARTIALNTTVTDGVCSGAGLAWDVYVQTARITAATVSEENSGFRLTVPRRR